MRSEPTSARDLTAIAICTVAWGTTWYAITLQLGTVDPIISLVYRFGLASAVMFAWCVLRGEKLGLSRSQHLAALGMGLFTFAIDYTLVYWAEERVTSAVVAVIFAALAFVNLIAFRLAFGSRSSPRAWVAAGLGTLGVGLLSWSEIAQAQFDRRALGGLTLAFVGVICASIGNIYARRGEEAGAGVAPLMAWAMGYGTALLSFFAIIGGKPWIFESSWPYVMSLLHLSLAGSVLTFLLYFALARRRGYTSASYISALTPVLAMGISAVFEGKRWGPVAFGGIALVLIGQALLFRTRSA